MIIVHVITRFIRGGADENTLLTCNGQASDGHEVHLIVGRETHPDMLARLDRRVVLHQMSELVHPVHPLMDLAAFASCFRRFRQLRPDIVHTHESKAGIIGRWAAFCARVPHIVHGVHILAFVGNEGRMAPVYRVLEQVSALVTDAFIDVSTGMRDECLRAGIGREENHHVVASGMDIDRYRRAARPQHWSEVIDPSLVDESLREGAVQFILMAGALEPRKRVLEFLSVIEPVLMDHPRCILLISGDGVLMPQLQSRLNVSSLRGRVVALGHRDDLEVLIALSDLCVHAAEREGLPRVVVQFVAGGKPVAAASLPGLDQIIRDGVSGALAPGGNLASLADKVAQLLSDGGMRQRMAEQAGQMDLSEWDARLMVRRLDEIYSTLKVS